MRESVEMAKEWRFVLEEGSVKDRRTKRCCVEGKKLMLWDEGKSSWSRWFVLINRRAQSGSE
jgi:hypothetical protein